jgi:5-methylcytosine-specific restriction endonuclease McrA
MPAIKAMPADAIAQAKAQGFICQRNYRGTRVHLRCGHGHTQVVEAANFPKTLSCPKCAKGPRKAREPSARKPRERSLKRWALKVIAKSGKVCQCCSQVGGDLEAHHLWSYESYPDKRHQIDNGMCLCKSCHVKFHQTFGYGENTPSQMTQYLKERVSSNA